jgi:uncharacterized protein
MTNLLVDNISNPSNSIHAVLADSFLSKLRGLMFKKSLDYQAGLLLAEKSESRINTSIHMLFMNFDICAVWINKSFQVVDVKFAKKWKLAFFPVSPAQYVLELNSGQMNQFHIGDQLEFIYEK